MAVTETRVSDFRAFAGDTDFVPEGGAHLFSVVEKPDGGFTTKWVLNEEASWVKPGFKQGGNHPVVCVSWDDAKAFADWLSDKEGRTYRLPRDAEWAAAVGTKRFPWGNEWPPSSNAGNFWDTEAIKNLPGDWKKSIIGGSAYEDGAERTAPVGTYAPNQHGFFDLAGNVWEWIAEDYSPSFNSPKLVVANESLQETHDASGRPFKTLRGGAWDNFTELDFLSELRDFDERDRRDDDYGFRLVLEVE